MTASFRAAAVALGCAALVACGNKKDDAEPPAPSVTASASNAPAPEMPRGPLSIVLESRAPIVFSAIEGGVVIADAARTHLARTAGDSEFGDTPMPAGLPTGPGRILRAAGRAPNSIWLLFEKQRDDGKPESNPIFRLERQGWKQLADDWKPAVTAWSKRRILAASTSSGHLKIKVIEPSLPKPPDDLPNVHLADPSCEKTLALADITALRTGEILAAGTCKPDIAAGAGASAKRYVVLRWPAPAAADAGAPPAASASAAPIAADAGPAEAPPSGPLASVDVLPGVSVALTHQALYARSAADVYVSALEETATPPASRLFHFDGTTWGAEPLPAGATLARGVAGTADGALWLVTDHAIWRRAAAAAPWEQIPPPTAGTWDFFDVRAVGDHDIWIPARRTDAAGTRDLVLRTRPARTVAKWD